MGGYEKGDVDLWEELERFSTTSGRVDKNQSTISYINKERKFFVAIED